MIVDFIERLNIPKVSWNTEVINGNRYITLTDEIYCAVFWSALFYNKIAPNFNNQYGKITLADFDKSMKVYILESTMQLAYFPSYWQEIINNSHMTKPFKIPNYGSYLNRNNLFVLFTMLILLTYIGTTLISNTLGDNSIYTVL